MHGSAISGDDLSAPATGACGSYGRSRHVERPPHGSCVGWAEPPSDTIKVQVRRGAAAPDRPACQRFVIS